MAADFTYDGSKIVTCNGTSGSPKTFADMCDADLAGTLELLAAWEPDSGTKALGTQLQPADSKGLLIDFVVAAKSAETDYIFITGTDIDGNAQTEALDVSAGNDTYTTTKWFATITNIDCSDNSAGGGTVWADGTVQVVQNRWGVVWEIAEDGQYRIDCNIEFGDETTSTHFVSKNEMVYFEDDKKFEVKDNAVLNLGEKVNDYPQNGSKWSLCLKSLKYFIATGSADAEFNIYGSILELRTPSEAAIYIFGNGDYELNRAFIVGGGENTYIRFYDGTGVLVDVVMNDVNTINYQANSDITTTNLHLHNTWHGIEPALACVITGLLITNVDESGYEFKQINAYTTRVVNPLFNLSDVVCASADAVIKEQYTCDLRVVDEDGMALDSVDITCHRASIVNSDTKVYKAVQDSTTESPGSNPDYWEDVSDRYDAADWPDWHPAINYKYREEVFAEKQRDRIEVTCADHAAIEGTYVEQDATHNDQPTYKLTGESWYIWYGDTNVWKISAEVGNETDSYSGLSGPYGGYEAPDPYENEAAAVQLSPQQIDTQYLDRKQWTLPADEIEEMWEYKLTFEHDDYPTLTLDKIVVTELVNWDVNMALSKDTLGAALQTVIESHHLDHVAEADTGKVALQADQAVNVTKVGGDAVSSLNDVAGVSTIQQGD